MFPVYPAGLVGASAIGGGGPVLHPLLGQPGSGPAATHLGTDPSLAAAAATVSGQTLVILAYYNPPPHPLIETSHI